MDGQPALSLNPAEIIERVLNAAEALVGDTRVRRGYKKMTKKQAKKMLVESFKRLPKRDRDRLLYHVQKGTKILCGDNWQRYIDGKGAGCPAVLAGARRVPLWTNNNWMQPLTRGFNENLAEDRVDRMDAPAKANSYLMALKDADEKTVTAAIRAACS